MDFIPFEKVSIEAAREALEKNHPAAAKQAASDNFKIVQRSDDSEAVQLSVTARLWLEQLPPHLHPKRLTAQFPRIANRVAELWTRPLYCEKYLDALVLDERGGREGFPLAVASELANLKIYFITHVMKRHFSTWGDRIGESR